jgi:ribosomal protein S19
VRFEGEIIMNGLAWISAAILIAGAAGVGCGGGGHAAGPDGGVDPTHGTAPVSDASGSARLCSDLFDQSTLHTFSIDISAAEWAKLQDELRNHLDLVLQGVHFETYHPITFHYGTETVADAMIRLKGQSSWYQTVTMDQAHPKAQFVIAFDQVNAKGTFHGVSKLDIDMPRSDWSFMHERLANNWFRKLGIMAACSSSVRIVINGQYYGVYVNEETVGHHLVADFFSANSKGDLFKGGVQADTNKMSPNFARLATWSAATTIPSMLTIIDLPSSLLEWAGDALIGNGDGFYGGDHNWYIYDQGAAGYVWLPADTDSSFDWLSLSLPGSTLSIDDHPIYWWVGRMGARPPSPHYLAVINDPTWRTKYVDAIATQLGHWDVQQFRSWIDTWSAQISDAVSTDPNKAAAFSDFQTAVGLAREMVEKRPAFLQSFVACERGQGGADEDGDGARWCDDCDDKNAAVHPGAPEVCGNGVDDNCDGRIDEGCPTPPDGGAVDGGSASGAPDASAG